MDKSRHLLPGAATRHLRMQASFFLVSIWVHVVSSR